MRSITFLAIAAVLVIGCAEHGSMPCSGQNCCRSQADCKQSFEQCFSPGQDIGCGACQVPPTTCARDSECAAQGPTAICGVARCTCNGEMSCIAGCLDAASCGEAQTCGADHRCAASACSAASPCPTNFDCSPGGTCARRSCTKDAGCDGVCVNGQCFATFGFCSAQPA